MRSFLFLQGPPSLFFLRLARRLRAQGHRTTRVNLCAGDRLCWPVFGALDYRGSAARWPDYLRGVLQDRTVTDVLMCGEQKPLHQAAMPVIRDHGAQVVVTDFGYLRPDWVTLELDGMTRLSRFPRDAEAIRALARQVDMPELKPLYADSFAAMAAWEVSTDILNWLFWFLYPHYRSHLGISPVRLYASAGWRLLGKNRRHVTAGRHIDELQRAGLRYFVFPLQMETDYQIRAYSPFDGLTEPIVTVLDSFARHAPSDVHLVVKIHPLDNGLKPWRRRIADLARARGLADRVVVLDGGVLVKLLAGSLGVITINSTVGVWAIRAGVPVFVLGEALYDVPGLTHQGRLESFWHAPEAPDRDLAKAWVRAAAGTIQVRGGYYSQEGRETALTQVAYRLGRGLVNAPLSSGVSGGRETGR